MEAALPRQIATLQIVLLSVPGRLLVVRRLQELEDGREAGPRRHLVGDGAGRDASHVDGAVVSFPEGPIEVLRTGNPIPPDLVEELRDARVGLLTRETVDGVCQGDGEDASRERGEELGRHVDGDDTSVAVRHDGNVPRGCPLLDDVLPDVPTVFLGSFTVSHWNAHAVDYAMSIVSVEHNDGVTEPLRSSNVRQLSTFLERVVDYEPPRPLTGSHNAAAVY